jgi:hypothetical protein
MDNVHHFAMTAEVNLKRHRGVYQFDRCFFFGFGVGSLLGVSQHGFFSIFPLALHRYIPFFSFTHMVSFGSVPNAVEISANKTKSDARDFMRVNLQQREGISLRNDCGDPIHPSKWFKAYGKGYYGLKRDYVEACKWYMLEVQNLDADTPSAKSSLEDLEKKMTPEEIAEAQKRASNFKLRLS